MCDNRLTIPSLLALTLFTDTYAYVTQRPPWASELAPPSGSAVGYARCVGRIGRYQAPAAYGQRVLIRSSSAVAILGIHALDAVFGIPSARCTAECSDKTLNPGSAKRSRCGCSPTGVSVRMVCYEYAMRGGGRGKLKAARADASCGGRGCAVAPRTRAKGSRIRRH